jgi:hypothetical protein
MEGYVGSKKTQSALFFNKTKSVTLVLPKLNPNFGQETPARKTVCMRASARALVCA